MPKLAKKTKVILVVLAFIFGVSAALFYFYLLPRVQTYRQVKEYQEKFLAADLQHLCQEFPVAKEIDSSKEYLEVTPYKGKDNITNLINKLSFLIEQYDFCRLWQGAPKGMVLNRYVGDKEREAAFTHFDIYRSINGIFKSSDCLSQETKQHSLALQNFIPEIKSVRTDEICYFLKNGGSDEETKAFCGENNFSCFVVVKGDPGLYKKMILDKGLTQTLKEDFIKYIQALRGNQKQYCLAMEDMLLRVACQSYFINNDLEACDKIFNEVNALSCNYQQ